MRILLTEGAGLTSRQVATRLDQLGHDVSACRLRSDVPGPLHPPRPHACTASPTSGRPRWSGSITCSPWPTRSHIDVIFPTQEQVTVLSHQLPRLLACGPGHRGAAVRLPGAGAGQALRPAHAGPAGGAPTAHGRRAGPIGSRRAGPASRRTSRPPWAPGRPGCGGSPMPPGLAEAVRHFIAAGALRRTGASWCKRRSRAPSSWPSASSTPDRSSPSTPTSGCRKGPTGARRPKSSVDAAAACAPTWPGWVEALDWHGAPVGRRHRRGWPGLRHRRQPAAGRAGQRPGGGHRHGRRAPGRGDGCDARHRSPVAVRRAHPPVPHGAPGRRPAHRPAPERAGRDRRGVSDGAASTPIRPKNCSPGGGTGGR